MSGAVRIQILGDKEVIGALNRFNLLAVANVKDAVNLAALNVQRVAKQKCPVDTGRLRGSIRVEFYSNGLGAGVSTDVKYAPAVEFGSGLYGPEKRKYPIRPKTAKVLAWPTQIASTWSPKQGQGGRALYGKKGVKAPSKRSQMTTNKQNASKTFALGVMHPGVRPRPFLFPAWNEERPQFVGRLEKALTKAASQVKTG